MSWETEENAWKLEAILYCQSNDTDEGSWCDDRMYSLGTCNSFLCQPTKLVWDKAQIWFQFIPHVIVHGAAKSCFHALENAVENASIGYLLIAVVLAIVIFCNKTFIMEA